MTHISYLAMARTVRRQHKSSFSRANGMRANAKLVTDMHAAACIEMAFKFEAHGEWHCYLNWYLN